MSESSDKEGPVPELYQEESNEAGTLYKYRDFANMPEEAEPEENSSPSTRGSLESSIRVQKFPVKLYAILGTKEFNEIVSTGLAGLRHPAHAGLPP
jgi:hypothetical protein